MFLQYGVRSITMDEIAKELAVSKKTLYVHYSNKQKLVRATSYYIFDSIIQGIHKIQKQGLNPILELYEIKRYTSENLKDEKSAPYYQLQKHYPEIASKLLNEQHKLLESTLTENLMRGIKAGLYRQEIPLAFVSKIYFIGNMGIRDRDVFPAEDFSHNQVVEMHMEYHIRAIATPKGLEELNNYIQEKE